MLDHTGVIVSDFNKSKKWYIDALKSIGYVMLMEFDKWITCSTDVAGIGESGSCPKPDFWISGATADRLVNKPGIHVAFTAANRKQVDEFYQAAIIAHGVGLSYQSH